MSLNRSQREKVDQFKSYTSEGAEGVAIRYLKNASWNVENALNAYFDSPPAASVGGGGGSGGSSGARSSGFSENTAKEWFERYRDLTLSGEKFGADGIQTFANDLGIDAEDTVLFLFAWKCNCSNFCEFSKEEFVNGLKDPEIRADSPEKLKPRFEWLRREIQSKDKFRDYYNWLFNYAKDTNARHMEQAIACSLWPLVLKDRFKLLDDWVAYLEEKHNRPINRDTWTQLLSFVNIVEEDPSLATYDPSDSWPVLIDGFVEWYKQKSGN